jgi:cell division protein FtsB
MKPRNYWKTGEGRQVLDAIQRGDLTFEQAAEMEGIPIDHLKTYYRTYIGGRQRVRTTRRMLPEHLVAKFLRQCEDFAASVIAAANTAVVEELAAKNKEIARLTERIHELEDHLEQLRRAARHAETERAAEILRRAGVAHGEH